MTVIVARRSAAVGVGRKTVAAGRGKKSSVKIAVEDSPALPSLEPVVPQSSVCVTSSLTMACQQELASLELRASVECATSTDVAVKSANPTIKLGK